MTSLVFNSSHTEFEAMAKKVIPSEFRMISGSHDNQVAVETLRKDFAKKARSSKSLSLVNIPSLSNTHQTLPENPRGKSGGACTQAFLSSVKDETGNALTSWATLLQKMKENLQDKGSKQVPQLSSSRHIDVKQPFRIVNDSKSNGIKRAVVIGINYVGSKGELFGCHSDAKNMIDFLKTNHSFEDENITILMDDGHHKSPTYKNIMTAFRKVTRESTSGDTVFLHYSGHGGRVKDTTGDENDGYDETVIPVDYFRAGQIVDDDINFDLVRKMKKGVLVTAMMDCCHSGTILDLPYRYRGGDDSGMGMEKDVFYADNDPPQDCCCFIY